MYTQIIQYLHDSVFPYVEKYRKIISSVSAHTYFYLF